MHAIAAQAAVSATPQPSCSASAWLSGTAATAPVASSKSPKRVARSIVAAALALGAPADACVTAVWTAPTGTATITSNAISAAKLE
jgi:hypothetical protein